VKRGLRLLKIAWWDWSVEKIAANLHLVNSIDIDGIENAWFLAEDLLYVLSST
jgi:hypothetical protein